MKNINDVINGFLGKKQNKERFFLAYLQIHWQEIVGIDIARKSFPNRIQNSVLFLDTVSSSWAHNLLMLKNDLLGKIKFAAKDKFFVEDIKTTVAKISVIEKEEIYEEEFFLPDLNNQEQSKIIDILSTVKEKSLRNKLFSFLIKDKKYKKYFAQKGYNKCCVCGIILTYDDIKCTVCKKDDRVSLKDKLLQLFLEIPWISFQDAQEYVSCDEEDFILIKKECEQYFLQKAIEKNAKSSDIRRFVMLKNNCPVFSLTEELIVSTMENVRRANNVSPSRFGRNG